MRFARRRRANATGRPPIRAEACKFGLSARHATSTPETTDWRKKLAASDAMRRKPVPRSYRRQETQTDPGGARHGGEPNRKISRRPSRDHEPKGKEQRRPRGRRPAQGRGSRHPRGAQRGQSNARRTRSRSAAAAQRARKAGNLAMLIARCGSASRDLKPQRCDAGKSYHVPFTGEGSVRLFARGAFGDQASQLRSKGSRAQFDSRERLAGCGDRRGMNGQRINKANGPCQPEARSRRSPTAPAQRTRSS